MIAKEGIRQSFQRRFDVKYKNKFNYWWYHFNTLLMMITSQATGIPTGNHGLFHRYLITIKNHKRFIVSLLFIIHIYVYMIPFTNLKVSFSI